MDDPNGLIWHGGRYHLFFQYHPEGSAGGPVSWGHATSSDLVHWSEQSVAIPAIGPEQVLSGSVVLDKADSAGLGEGGPAPLVAVYTTSDPSSGRRAQALASSVDGGYSWRRYAGSPAAGVGPGEFGDPKVFRHEPSRAWVMVVAGPDGRSVQIWNSPDLRSWVRTGQVGPHGPADGGGWEVPDLVEVPIVPPRQGQAAGWPASRWVLSVSVNAGGPAGGSGMVYAVGDFDGREFTPLQDGDAFGPFSWVEHGPDFYAATSCTELPAGPDGDAAPVWMGWLGNWGYADVTPTSPWRGTQSLPRRLHLRPDGERLLLAQSPVAQLLAARQGAGTRLLHVELPALPLPGTVAATAGAGLAARPPAPASALVRRVVPGAGGCTLELRLDVEVGPGSAAGVEVLASADGRERTRICFDEPSGQLLLDRRASGTAGFHPAFAAVCGEALDGEPVTSGPAAGGRRVRFAVWVDACCVEVFGGEGEVVLSAQAFAGPESVSVALFAENGPALVRELLVWPLDPPAGRDDGGPGRCGGVPG